jgi:hypothetical protein
VAAASVSSRSTLLLLAGAAILVTVAVLLAHRSSQAQAAQDSSGRPGPDLTGSAAQQPSGGAASVPGQLPDTILTSTDPLQQQVQQADTSSSDSPQMLSLASAQSLSLASAQSVGVQYGLQAQPDGTVISVPFTSGILPTSPGYVGVAPTPGTYSVPAATLTPKATPAGPAIKNAPFDPTHPIPA